MSRTTFGMDQISGQKGIFQLLRGKNRHAFQCSVSEQLRHANNLPRHLLQPLPCHLINVCPLTPQATCHLPSAAINEERRRWRVFLRPQSRVRVDRQQGQWDAKIPQCICDCVCILSGFSCVQLYATLWTIARQVPVHRILQARKLEWIAMPFSRGSFQCRDWNCVSYIYCSVGFLHATDPGTYSF